MKMKKTKTKNSLWAGIAGGFAATTCCIAPIIIVLLGLGTAFGMAVMHQFHIVSIVSGIVLMFLISLYLVKRESGVCNINSIKQNWKGISIAIISMVVGWFIINYFIIGIVATNVYGNLEVNQKPLGNLQEMAESHGMPEMANIKVIPENEGEKLIVFDVEGIFCGSCGPGLEYDIKSISGVKSVDRSGKRMFITYNSNITSKDVIIASVHSPYSAKIISEEKI